MRDANVARRRQRLELAASAPATHGNPWATGQLTPRRRASCGLPHARFLVRAPAVAAFLTAPLLPYIRI